MTTGAFLAHIRAYAALSQRYRRSYAEQVNVIVENYKASIERDGVDKEAAAKQMEWADRAVAREYGTADLRWTAPGESPQ